MESFFYLPHMPMSHNRYRVLLSIVLLIVAIAPPVAVSGEPVLRPEGGFVVAVTPSPPFSYPSASGEWHGLTVDLWRHIAHDLELDFVFYETTVAGLLSGVSEGRIDVGAAAIVVTAEREQVMDFSHSFYSGGLSVATQREVASVFQAILRSLFTWPFFLVVSALLGLLLAVGFLVWLAERKLNQEQFGGTTIEGIGSGFWWSAVTMTTVGYGDKYPLTRIGKLIGFIWMFSSLLLLSIFTGAIASALTISSIQPRISSFQDLYGARVGVVSESQAHGFLLGEGIAVQKFPDTAAGLQAVADGRLDGFVNDAALLRHIVRRDFPGRLTVLENEFQTGFYALTLRSDLPQLRDINLSLLQFIQSEQWQALLRRHMGH